MENVTTLLIETDQGLIKDIRAAMDLIGSPLVVAGLDSEINIALQNHDPGLVLVRADLWSHALREIFQEKGASSDRLIVGLAPKPGVLENHGVFEVEDETTQQRQVSHSSGQTGQFFKILHIPVEFPIFPKQLADLTAHVFNQSMTRLSQRQPQADNASSAEQALQLRQKKQILVELQKIIHEESLAESIPLSDELLPTIMLKATERVVKRIEIVDHKLVEIAPSVTLK